MAVLYEIPCQKGIRYDVTIELHKRLCLNGFLNKKSPRGLNGGFFWCPLAEDLRTSIIESVVQCLDFSFKNKNPRAKISN